jgi:hypothetical protein
VKRFEARFRACLRLPAVNTCAWNLNSTYAKMTTYVRRNVLAIDRTTRNAISCCSDRAARCKGESLVLQHSGMRRMTRRRWRPHWWRAQPSISFQAAAVEKRALPKARASACLLFVPAVFAGRLPRQCGRGLAQTTVPQIARQGTGPTLPASTCRSAVRAPNVQRSSGGLEEGVGARIKAEWRQ